MAQVHCFVHDDEPRCASFAPSSPVLATAAADGTLSLFDLDSGELVHVVAQAFGLSVPGQDKASALGAIEKFLHDEARAGRRCLLVVEALLPGRWAGSSSLQAGLLPRTEPPRDPGMRTSRICLPTHTSLHIPWRIILLLSRIYGASPAQKKQLFA